MSVALVRRRSQHRFRQSPSPHPLFSICCPCNPRWNAPRSESDLFFCVCVSARVYVLYPKDIVCVLSFKKHQAHDHSYQSCLRDYCNPPPLSFSSGYSSWVSFHNSSLCGGSQAFHHWLQTIEEIEKVGCFILPWSQRCPQLSSYLSLLYFTCL